MGPKILPVMLPCSKLSVSRKSLKRFEIFTPQVSVKWSRFKLNKYFIWCEYKMKT